MEFELSAGLYAAGVQIAAVVVLVYVVVALIGAPHRQHREDPRPHRDQA